MWQYMNAKEPSVFVSDIEEGVKRVQESNGKYAFLLESVYNDFYNNKKPCDTMKVGNPLNRNHYGIATRKYSPLRYGSADFFTRRLFLLGETNQFDYKLNVIAHILTKRRNVRFLS